MATAHNFLIAVFGPTATGKTKLGVSLAKSFQGEVISVDSLQCYEAAGVVTAKPEPSEMEGIPHHLIGYLNCYEEPHNDFVNRAIGKVGDISHRGSLPILVGGSISLTIPLLLEAFKLDYRMIALILVPHNSTYPMIVEDRMEDMLQRGLLDELSELKQLEEVYLDKWPAFQRGVWKAIGYQELYPFLKSSKVDTDRAQLLQTGLASLKANTLQYGFRQLEWIRHTLTPLLHQEKVTCISLAVTDKESWHSGVETPAISMINEYFHGLSPPNSTPINGRSPRVVCIFGGSSSGNNPAYAEAAKSLATVFHRNNIKLVYGGGTTGIMGAIASSLVKLSGPAAVHGIIPAALAKYYEEKITGQDMNNDCITGFGKRTVVKDMHTRKRLMIQSVLSGGPGSGFVALSGGYGTLEELLEVTTWYQLGIHDCRICLYSVNGFYDGLISWLGQVVREGFVGQVDASIIGMVNTSEEVVEYLEHRAHNSRKGTLEWF